jgi:hypothetical protein
MCVSPALLVFAYASTCSIRLGWVAYLRGSGSVLAKVHTYIGLCLRGAMIIAHRILIFAIYDSIYMFWINELISCIMIKSRDLKSMKIHSKRRRGRWNRVFPTHRNREIATPQYSRTTAPVIPFPQTCIFAPDTFQIIHPIRYVTHTPNNPCTASTVFLPQSFHPLNPNPILPSFLISNSWK